MARSVSVPGLTRRKHRAQYERVLPKIDRVSKALECDYDDPRAVERAQALNTLAERGDLNVIARWRDEGKPHITEIVRAVRQGDYRTLQRLNVEGPTLQGAVSDYMERAENTLNPATADQYRAQFNQLLAHFGGDTPMASIRTPEAEAFLWAPRGKDSEPWAAGTQNDYRTNMGALWRFVMDREREQAEVAGAVPNIGMNPWKKAKVRRRTKTRHAFLLPEDWRGLITHERVRGTPVAALLGLGCLAGLRRGEICNLRTGFDVDLDAGLLRIQERSGEYAWEPKGYSHGITNSVRDVPIVPALRELLEAHIAKGYAGARYFLHGQYEDRPLSPATAHNWAKDALEAAGLTFGRDDEDSLTLHSLRHTCATWMISDGVPIPTVAKWLGNTKEVTLNTYAHHVPKDEARALEAIQRRAA